MISNIFKQMLRHKFITGIILLLVVAGGYFGYQNLTKGKNTVRYATAAVERGTLIISVSGSGQLNSSNQVDIKPKVSSEVAALYVKKGDEVKKGELLVKLDDTDFQKAVSDAEISLETAKLELEELLSPPDELDLFQAENALTKANESKTRTEEGIQNGFEDAFNSITNIFFDLPTIITMARDVLYGYDIAKSEITLSDYDWNITVYKNSFSPTDRIDLDPFMISAEDDYAIARIKYDQNLKDYKNTDYYADSRIIENLLNETADTTKVISQAIKSEINLLDFVVDYFSSHDKRIYSGIDTYRTSLQSYYSKTNSYLQNFYSIQNSLEDNRQTVVDADLSVKEKELSLERLKEGPDELDIRTKEFAVQQKEDALIKAKQNLADCYVYSPFDGIVADVKVKKGDSVSSGTALGSLITKQQIAEISLNEVDIAQLKFGQKATLTFDAVPDLTISGKVSDVDTLGTTNQGVVSYGVQITLDTQDDRVKPGMSVTTDIITNSKQDVLVVPNGAIKSQGNSSYVELVEAPDNNIKQQLSANVSGVVLATAPKMQNVETGLSNDLYAEIISGLQEGDIVVTSTITPNTTQTNQNQGTQGFQIPGIGSQMRISR